MEQDNEIENLKPATVHVYDYYKPGEISQSLMKSHHLTSHSNTVQSMSFVPLTTLSAVYFLLQFQAWVSSVRNFYIYVSESLSFLFLEVRLLDTEVMFWGGYSK